jgi:pimeloyl-ACP methyl ester carboxylesterase
VSLQPTRHFLDVSGRRVHYLSAGFGPPVVLVHSSPANALMLLPEIALLAPQYTVYAFDTPGFGWSEALPMQHMLVADLADALADTLQAIVMPPCPFFGTHTGAAITLEFAMRHPARVTGVVLDGVPIFTADECAALFGAYFRDIEVNDLGGQYPMAWTRMRDQSTWFPWYAKSPDRLNAYGPGTPESIHRWVSMYFQAQDTYVPAYRAASMYSDGAIDAAAALQVPAIFCAPEHDMLYPHLDRLPPLKHDQSILRLGRAESEKHALIETAFARFGSPHAPPPDQDAIVSSPHMVRQFAAGGNGRQLHLRHGGSRSAPPLLLLHDSPGSSAALREMISLLAPSFFVIAPDLPGAGESEPFDSPRDIAGYAAEIAALLDTLGLAQVDICGFGFGASLAVEVAHRFAARVRWLALCGLLLPDPAERAALVADYAPPISIERDGSHWYRTWLMLRDQHVWWPWYDRRVPTLRRVTADFAARPLHEWTLDVMRTHATYGDQIHAALAHDAAAALAQITAPLVLPRGTGTPLDFYQETLAALRPDAASPDTDGSAESLASALRTFFIS